MKQRPHRVVMVGYPQAQILDITGPLEVFARTARWLKDNKQVRHDAYETELVSIDGKLVKTSGGLELVANRKYCEVRSAQTVLIAGGIGYRALLQDKAFALWIHEQARKSERLGSICTGSLLLANAGLLKHRRATTHWAYFDRLRELEPTLQVDCDAIYVRDQNIYSSAGVTAGMDMALGMVEEDWGKSTALAIAQELVMFLKRPGGQSQFSRHLAAQQRDDVFGELELWILEHLDSDLSVESLARRAHLSPRHFARLFRSRLGATPAAYVRRVRVEEARRRMENDGHRIKRLARSCGFADEQQLRRAYKSVFGVTPADYRARFSGD